MTRGLPAGDFPARSLVGALALLAACAAPDRDVDAPDSEPGADAHHDAGDATDVSSLPDAGDARDDALPADADAPDTSDDAPVHNSDVAASDTTPDNDTTADSDTASDTSYADVADASPACRCASVETCADTDCIDVRARPCRTDADCAEWRCSRRGYCAAPTAFDIEFRRDDERAALFPWPTTWSSTLSSSFSPWYAFSPGSGTVSTFFAAAAPVPPATCLATSTAAGWESSEAVCAARTVRMVATAWLPAGRGERTLLAGGSRQLRVIDADGTVVRDLFDQLGEDDRRRDCAIGYLGVSDIDLDGLLDVYAECAEPVEVGGRAQAGLLWLGRDAGGFVLVDDPSPWAPITTWGHRLADALHDADGDGLLDRILINDSYSTPDAQNTLLEPGWRVRTCAPTESCLLDAAPVANGRAAWGSFMGAARIHLADGTERLYLTDLGPSRLLDVADPEVPDDAERAGVGTCPLPGDVPGTFLFSWSSIVEDLGHDGLDDLFVTRGDATAAGVLRGTAQPHPNLLFEQRSDGTFTCRSDPAWSASDDLDLSRGAIALDLDYDGLLDVFVARWQRAPLLLEEVDHGQPRRCSVRMVPSVVPAAGYGLASAPFPDGPWTIERMGGQTAIQPPNEFVTTLRSGYARFPSGAVLPFDCGDGAGPVVLEEPDWIELDVVDGTVRVTLDASVWPEPVAHVALVSDGERPAVPVSLAPDGAGRWTAPIPPIPARAMVRINDRWVGVWLPTGS